MSAGEPPAELSCGIYEHYKGGRYLVIGLARDDRDETLLVVYVRLYERFGVPMTARPLHDFLATVESADGNVPRFRYVGPSGS